MNLYRIEIYSSNSSHVAPLIKQTIDEKFVFFIATPLYCNIAWIVKYNMMAQLRYKTRVTVLLGNLIGNFW